MTELRGAPVAKAITEKCREKIEKLAEKGIVPTLAIVRVGARSDDESYEKGAEKRFANAGANVKKILLDEDVSQEELEKVIIMLNNDSSVHGILLFRPLPKQINEDKIKQLISMEKDVDGMSYAAMGALMSAKGSNVKFYAPCTPTAVMELLEFYNIDLTGKKVTVVGRSAVVGMPLTIMLINKNATVKVCHTRTKDTALECADADIIVAAAGKAKVITSKHAPAGKVLVDVGINFVDGVMCGDMDYEELSKTAEAITPVPGGVGAVTTSVLLKHTVDSTERVC